MDTPEGDEKIVMALDLVLLTMIINVTELFFSLSSLAAVMILPVVSFIMKSSP